MTRDELIANYKEGKGAGYDAARAFVAAQVPASVRDNGRLLTHYVDYYEPSSELYTYYVPGGFEFYYFTRAEAQALAA